MTTEMETWATAVMSLIACGIDDEWRGLVVEKIGVGIVMGLTLARYAPEYALALQDLQCTKPDTDREMVECIAQTYPMPLSEAQP